MHYPEVEDLKDQFFGIIENSFSADEAERIRSAHNIASDLHRDKLYASVSYDLHLLEVAEGLVHVGFASDQHADLIIAGLYHDSFEDVPEQLLQFVGSGNGSGDVSVTEALEKITKSEKVALFVQMVSNRPFPDDIEPTEENKIRFYADNLRQKFIGDVSEQEYDPELFGKAVALKIIDTYKNTKRLHSVKSKTKRAYLRKKYTESLKVLEEAYKLHVLGNPSVADQAEELNKCLDGIELSIGRSHVMEGYLER